MKVMIILISVFLVGCTTQPQTDSKKAEGPMTGTPLRGDIRAFAEMCKREPESILCSPGVEQ